MPPLQEEVVMALLAAVRGQRARGVPSLLVAKLWRQAVLASSASATPVVPMVDEMILGMVIDHGSNALFAV